MTKEDISSVRQSTKVKVGYLDKINKLEVKKIKKIKYRKILVYFKSNYMMLRSILINYNHLYQ